MCVQSIRKVVFYFSIKLMQKQESSLRDSSVVGTIHSPVAQLVRALH